ncbi:hypothetical protein RUM44_000579 [Polyplax serrata]|uniref:Uncharacterized protein n=1 Tax=Polyplax serrata TaxID=468196 RepID=A0ABR1B5U7_POLSC
MVETEPSLKPRLKVRVLRIQAYPPAIEKPMKSAWCPRNESQCPVNLGETLETVKLDTDMGKRIFFCDHPPKTP